MSFTTEVKQELMGIKTEDCCFKAELSAMIRMNGLLATVNGITHLDIQTENAAIARRIFRLIKLFFTDPVDIIVRKKMKLKKNNIYIVRIKQHAARLLEQLQIDYEEDSFELSELEWRLQNEGCREAYLRGAFLARGSMNNPETSSYHLEIFNLDSEHNHIICELLNNYDLGAKELQRRNGYIVYLKEAEKITEFLNIIGANNALFKFEDVRIVRDMRNSVNRIVNCETANLNKTIGASVKQVENIHYIKETSGLDVLPDKLKEVAEVRIAYPEATLKEVGELLPSGPLSKSGVNHRLKKINTIAESLETENDKKS